MEVFQKQWRKWCTDPRRVMSVFGFGVGLLGIGMMWTGILPLSWPNFIFFTFLFFLIALYRPNITFLILIATLPLETISLTPSDFSFSLRPYQWLMVIVLSALVIRLLSGRTQWPLFTLSRYDIFLALIPLGTFISGLLHGGEGIRLAAIVTTFYILYVIGRIFFRTTGDVSLAAMMLSTAGFVVLCFGILQNVAFEFGWALDTVMPGRPNATFTEPDWLGFFAVILLILGLARMSRSSDDSLPAAAYAPSRLLLGLFFLLPIIMVLILTVSRSAWLAAGAAIVTWIAASLVGGGAFRFRYVLSTIQLLVIGFILALFIVVDLPLTRFDLLDRAGSTATGEQEITVACSTKTELPAIIENLTELTAYGCRHITLEERETLRAAGQSIQTVSRPDPNIVIRAQIYQTTWREIRAHPISGIGWGNIGTVLGRDANGMAYNASNLWFELILGAGLLGILGLFGFLGLLVYQNMMCFTLRPSIERQQGATLILSLVSAFLVFNLFNAGFLLGLVWIGFAALVRLSLGDSSAYE